MNTAETTMQTVLHSLHLPDDDTLCRKLAVYFERLVSWNSKVNLTAITACQDVAEKHFADSLLLLKTDWLSHGARCIDVGTGAGFPGVVLKLARPDIHLTLLDSLKKRTDFLRLLCHELELDVSILHARAEDAALLPEYRERFDCAFSRAVASAPVLSEYLLPFVAVDGSAIGYKSTHAQEEFASAQRAIELLGGDFPVAVQSFDTAWGKRALVQIHKSRPTPRLYPRKAGLPNKRPL